MHKQLLAALFLFSSIAATPGSLVAQEREWSEEVLAMILLTWGERMTIHRTVCAQFDEERWHQAMASWNAREFEVLQKAHLLIARDSMRFLHYRDAQIRSQRATLQLLARRTDQGLLSSVCQEALTKLETPGSLEKDHPVEYRKVGEFLIAAR